MKDYTEIAIGTQSQKKILGMWVPYPACDQHFIIYVFRGLQIVELMTLVNRLYCTNDLLRSQRYELESIARH